MLQHAAAEGMHSLVDLAVGTVVSGGRFECFVGLRLLHIASPTEIDLAERVDGVEGQRVWPNADDFAVLLVLLRGIEVTVTGSGVVEEDPFSDAGKLRPWVLCERMQRQAVNRDDKNLCSKVEQEE